MEALVTLEQAKQHLRITHAYEDDDLRMKLRQAQATIIDYLDGTSSTTWAATMAAWTEETAPEYVQAAILLLLSSLVDHRGDDDGNADDVWNAIRRLLARTRTPVVA